MTKGQENQIVLEQDWVWGSVTLPSGYVAIAVLGEQDGRGYYLSLNGASVSGIVGFRDSNKTPFYGWLDRNLYKGINVTKAYKYLVDFGKTLRHPVDTDLSLDSLKGSTDFPVDEKRIIVPVTPSQENVMKVYEAIKKLEEEHQSETRRKIEDIEACYHDSYILSVWKEESDPEDGWATFEDFLISFIEQNIMFD